MSEKLKPCPFCGGEADLEQTGKMELTIRCVGPQPSGLRGCGPKYVQKITPRFTLEWLADVMTKNWNRRTLAESVMGIEPPASQPLRRSEADPTWIQVIKLFQQHGMAEPPFRLRDELVVALEWAWFGQSVAAPDNHQKGH